MSNRKKGKVQKSEKFFKSSLQTHKVLFRQSYLKRFNRKPKLFQKRIFVRKRMIPKITIFITECSMGHIECSFDNSAWLFLPIDRKFVIQGSENIKKNKSFFKIALWHREDSSTTRRKTFRQKHERFLPSDWTITIFRTISQIKK